jgi:von Willebrand factor type A domain
MAIWPGDRMSGRIPTWLADWLGVSLASDADAATWHLDSAWRCAPWATVLLLIAAAAWTALLYGRESTNAGRRYRGLLIALRLSAIALLLVMVAQWALALRLTGPPTIALAIDRSASMGVVDRYTDPRLVSQINQQLGAGGFSEATRLNLAKVLLTQENGRWFKELAQRYRPVVYYVDGAVERSIKAESATQRVDAVREISSDGPHGQATRLGDAVRQVLDDFRGAPPAAVILFSDGVATEGVPLASAAEDARRSGVPIIAVGLGSDIPPQDIEVADVLVDDAVFVDDVVSLQIQIKTSGLEGQPAKITLRNAGATGSAQLSSPKSASAFSVLAEQTIQLPRAGETLLVRLIDRPHEPGEINYVVDIEPREEETNRENNRQTRTVAVLDEKIRVLMVQAYPSYEFRFLKSLLERDDTIELSTYLQDADPEFAEQDKTALRSFPLGREELFEYDVIVLGDVDPRLLPRSVWQNVRAFVMEKGGGAAFLAGPRFFPWLYGDNADVGALLPIDAGTISAAIQEQLPSQVTDGFVARPTPLGLQSPALQLGDAPAATERIWRELAPLYWLYEVEKLKPAAQVLAAGGGTGSHAERGEESRNPQAEIPLIVFQYVGPGRVLFHAIDSTWRWRLGAGDVYFARYWVQTTRFLARGKLSGGQGAQLAADRREFRLGEPVQLRARFLDPRLAPAGDEVAVLIESPGQARRRATLRRNPSAAAVFEAALTDLAEGKYEALLAEPQLPGNPAAARFEVVAPPGELANLEMDAVALRAAAETTHGKFYTFEDADRLLDELPAGRRVPMEHLPPVSLWNRWWLLAAFVACISIEWILRKRKGML